MVLKEEEMDRKKILIKFMTLNMYIENLKCFQSKNMS